MECLERIIVLAKQGLWSTLHEVRTDVSMLLGLLFLLLVGGGTLSLDEHLSARFGSSRWLNRT
jgi:putative oxidoreductase